MGASTCSRAEEGSILGTSHHVQWILGVLVFLPSSGSRMVVEAHIQASAFSFATDRLLGRTVQVQVSFQVVGKGAGSRQGSLSSLSPTSRKTTQACLAAMQWTG